MKKNMKIHPQKEEFLKEEKDRDSIKENEEDEDSQQQEELEQKEESEDEYSPRYDTKTPSRRIRKNHPKTITIGDKYAGVSTRRRLMFQE